MKVKRFHMLGRRWSILIRKFCVPCCVIPELILYRLRRQSQIVYQWIKIYFKIVHLHVPGSFQEVSHFLLFLSNIYSLNCHGWMGSTPTSYSGGPRFKQPGDWLCWLKVFFFLSPFIQMPLPSTFFPVHHSHIL